MLEHVSLTVRDLEAETAFLLCAFPAYRVRGGGDERLILDNIPLLADAQPGDGVGEGVAAGGVGVPGRGVGLARGRRESSASWTIGYRLAVRCLSAITGPLPILMGSNLCRKPRMDGPTVG